VCGGGAREGQSSAAEFLDIRVWGKNWCKQSASSHPAAFYAEQAALAW